MTIGNVEVEGVDYETKERFTLITGRDAMVCNNVLDGFFDAAVTGTGSEEALFLSGGGWDVAMELRNRQSGGVCVVAGIHEDLFHAEHAVFWQAVVLFGLMNNWRLVATSHSHESIRAYAAAAARLYDGSAVLYDISPAENNIARAERKPIGQLYREMTDFYGDRSMGDVYGQG